MLNKDNIFRLLQAIIAFVVLTWFLKEFATLAVPLVLGIILGLIFAPLLITLRKHRVSALISFIIIVAMFIVISIIFSYLLVSSLYSITNNFAEYQEKIATIIFSITKLFSLPNQELIAELQNNALSALQENVFSYSKSLIEFSFKIVSQYTIVALTMIFVLIERSLFYIKIEKYYKGDKQASTRVSKLLYDINAQVSRFLLLKTLISLSTSIVIYVGFTLIGVDFAFLWAILTFVFNFIPNVGSIIITILSVAFSFIQFFPHYGPVLLVVLLTISTQMLVGNIIDPKIMGDNLNLSPLVIWFSLIYWGWVWGTIGALLAVPIAVILRVLFEFVPSFRSVGLFMGNSGAIIKFSQNQKKEQRSTNVPNTKTASTEAITTTKQPVRPASVEFNSVKSATAVEPNTEADNK